MKLFLFNPSHDEALAAHTPYYYPTKIARRLAVEWGMLPGIWARKGDCVWVDDAVTEAQWKEAQGEWCEGVRFVHKKDMNAAFWAEVEAVSPWGWDALVRLQLEKAGAPAHLLPTVDEMETIRLLSSRHTTAEVLPPLVERLCALGMPAVGETRIVTTPDEAVQVLREHQGAMVKALWSCSGRGVFHVSSLPSESERGRLAKLLREQGAVEMQPFYEGIFDFALEFTTDAEGLTHYEGPSLFRTNPLGGYSGNVIISVEELENHIAEQIGGTERFRQLVESCIEVLTPVFAGRYVGPSGIDMMLVRTADGVKLFPCVEVNVRRTMGHVALNLIKRTLKAESLPPELRNLWYFCTKLS